MSYAAFNNVLKCPHCGNTNEQFVHHDEGVSFGENPAITVVYGCLSCNQQYAARIELSIAVVSAEYE